MAEADQRKHGDFFSMVTTPYVNTIPAYKQPTYPGDLAAEARINAFIRWNAMAMVLRAGKHSNVGGHIATYQSAAVLYDVGFTHFFRGRTDDFAGDMVYIGAIPPPAFMAAPISKAASTRSCSTTFAANPRAVASPPTRTRG